LRASLFPYTTLFRSQFFECELTGLFLGLGKLISSNPPDFHPRRGCELLLIFATWNLNDGDTLRGIWKRATNACASWSCSFITDEKSPCIRALDIIGIPSV